MESKKINQLATSVNPSTSDLAIIGDPITGVSKKITWLQVSSLIGTAANLQQVTDNGATTTNPITIGGLTISGLSTGVLKSDSGVISSVPFGGANGVATLGGDGKVPSNQLPSYVDDVVEVANYAALPATGETGKIYITLDNNKVYRWTGSTYVEIAANNAVWGAITGTLSNQTDLQNAFNAKVPYTGATGAVNLGAYDLTANELTIGKGTNSLSNNTALGHQALFHITTGNYNTGVGHESLHNTSSGQYNTAIGQSSLFTNTTGSQNTAIGLNALLYNTSGGSNVVVGLDAMQHNTTGGSNTALGYNAGSHITGGSTPNTTASNSVYIGRDSKAKLDGQSNEIVIGYNAIGNGSNTATFGNSSITANYFTGSINGGSLDISGTGRFTGQLRLDSTITNGTYTYTLPSATGTLALTSDIPSLSNYVTLDTTQTITAYKTFTGYSIFTGITSFSGYQPRFNNGISLNYTYSGGSLSGHTTLGANTNGLQINTSDGGYNNLNFASTTTGNTYTFPNATGTIALTSDIPSVTNFVTLNTLQTIIGTKIYSSLQYYNNGVYLQEGTSGSSTGYTSLAGNSNGIKINLGTGTSNNNLNFASTSSSNTYTFPNATGTIALTSNLSSYVPTSRTLTINGTAYDLSADRAWTISGSQWTTSGSDIYYNTGNVGINQSTPTYKLDITGTLRTTDTIYGNSYIVTNGNYIRNSNQTDGTGTMYLDASNLYIRRADNGTGLMSILSSGNVGIGLTNPSFPLEVSSTSTTLLARSTSNQANAAIRIVNSSSNGGRTYSIGSGDTTSAAGNNFYIYDETNGAIRFAINNSGNITTNGSLTANGVSIGASDVRSTSGTLTLGGSGEVIRITSTAKVGIGTSSPVGLLQLSGAIANSADAATLTIKQPSTSYNNGIYIERSGERTGYFMYVSSASDALTFRRNWVGTQSDVMTLTRDGNVGVNCTPNAQFEVFGTSGNALTDGIRISRNTLQTSQYGVINYTSGILNITGVETSSGGEIRFNTSNGTTTNERVRLNNSGNLLIGQTTPSGSSNGIYFRAGVESGFIVTNDIALQLSRLGSTGDIQSFYSGTTRVGTISVSGSNTSYNTSSDYRLKEDLKDYNGLNIISKIKTYDFAWVNDKTRNYGVIAHEVEEVIPYIVMGKKDGEFYQGVDYSKIVPVLIKAIQELKAEIEELKNK